MSQQRLKRLQRLEARRPSAVHWVDPFDAAQRLLQAIEHDAPAVAAGRAEWIPVYGPPTEAVDTALRRVMQDLDRVAARLKEGR